MRVLVYGASDDLVEIDGDLQEEFYLPGGDETEVVLTAPDGTSMAVEVGFCTANPDGWHLRVTSTAGSAPSWPMRWVPRPGGDPDEDDPALEVVAPDGTTVTQRGAED